MLPTTTSLPLWATDYHPANGSQLLKLPHVSPSSRHPAVPPSRKSPAVPIMADDNRLVYAWTLRDAGISRSTKKHLPKKSERVVKEPDNRSQVPPSDIRNGGRFRPVVKVRTVMGDWIHNGTGWLIREDLVVTAGHIVVDVPFEQCKIQTFATIVQVYIGYRGKDAMDAMDSPDVDFRKGTRVVVPWGYAVMKKSVNDFAFVQLNQPFRNVSPIEPRVTPPFGTAELCVVGYPTDKKKIYVDEEEEDGAEMYEDSAPVTWRLERHQGLLAYQISTEAGKFPRES